MLDNLNHRLLDAKERSFRLKQAERKREQLLQRFREQERLIVQLELKLEAEQADVDKLTKLSLTNLFHTILRSKDEQLELERQQALAAALQLQEAKQALDETKACLREVGDDLTLYRNAETEYKELIKLKESTLRSMPSSSSQLTEMEEQIADQTLLVKELQESLTAGRRVLASLKDASASLEKAENWGKWDLWGGGGMISTHQKHNHVDDARTYIHNANHLMLNFRDELQDLNRRLDIYIDISETLKMADYWFDGLITDWIVQGRIRNSQEQTLKVIRSVQSVVNQLQTELSAAETELHVMNAKRNTWIEEKGSH